MHAYIPIRSIEDIDLTSIGLHNIENRYIDEDGRRFVTRFNLRTHKIEIVQIVLGEEEARLLQQKNFRRKIKRGDTEDDDDSHTPKKDCIHFKMPSFLKKMKIEPSLAITSDFVEENFSTIVSTLKERLLGILNNMKFSQAFNDEKSQKGGDFILESMTTFDRKVSEPLEAANDKLIEFIKYPRPASAYLSIFSGKQKQILDTWNSHDVLELAKAITVGELFFTAVEGSYNLLLDLNAAIDDNTIRKASTENKQRLEDAKTTIEFLSKQVLEESAKILGWWKSVKAI